MSIGEPCPSCGHTTHQTTAVGRFQPVTGGYRDAGDSDGPTRATRADAEVDVCRRQAADGWVEDWADGVASICARLDPTDNYTTAYTEILEGA